MESLVRLLILAVIAIFLVVVLARLLGVLV